MDEPMVFAFQDTRNWVTTRSKHTPIFNDLFRRFYARQWLTERVREGREIAPEHVAAIADALR